MGGGLAASERLLWTAGGAILGDVVIIGGRLRAVMDAYAIGRRSYTKTKQNLALAFALNGIGVAIAVTGLVHPVWAMVAMVTSVSAVLLNSFGARLVLRACTSTGSSDAVEVIIFIDH